MLRLKLDDVIRAAHETCPCLACCAHGPMARLSCRITECLNCPGCGKHHRKIELVVEAAAYEALERALRPYAPKEPPHYVRLEPSLFERIFGRTGRCAP